MSMIIRDTIFNAAVGCAVCFLSAPASPAQTITTFAGNGTAGFSGDNGPAGQAMINGVAGLAADSAGNVYLAEQNNNRVRKVDRNGIITTLAGTGVAGFSGDNGSASQAQLNGPLGVCVDSSSNVYVTDQGNKRVRKISNGVITTFAGNGSGSSSGDGGVALAAGFVMPIRCAADSAGNLYIADQGAQNIRVVDIRGNINTYAGNGTAGFSGDGGPATQAALNGPAALSTDSLGNLYITDQNNNRIRRVDTNGFIDTVAGSGRAFSGGDGGPAVSAGFSFPGSVVADRGGSLFIVDTLAARIRKVNDDMVTTVAGTGNQGFGGDGGPPLQAMFSSPFAITVDNAGNLYIGDGNNNRIRKISGIAVGIYPWITSAGVTNGASFQTGIVPGGIVTIFGFNLGARLGQIMAATGSTWLTDLSGISVTMDGTPVPVYRALNMNGKEQLSIQAPFALAGKTSTSVIVSNASGTSVSVSVPVLTVQPGIFLLDTDRNAAVHANGTIVTAANQAARGETVVLYLTGLGAVGNAPASGQPASLTTLSPTLVTPQVTMAGLDAQVSFSGLTPGFIGLYQINAVVPTAVGTGSMDVTVTANGVTSNVARMSVR
jgi:uncharacterized protein (TIGR03437 family)